ncbi:MAG: hypothetical protein R2881_07530 [Eubacteriales bacterium]
MNILPPIPDAAYHRIRRYAGFAWCASVRCGNILFCLSAADGSRKSEVAQEYAERRDAARAAAQPAVFAKGQKGDTPHFSLVSVDFRNDIYRRIYTSCFEHAGMGILACARLVWVYGRLIGFQEKGLL